MTNITNVIENTQAIQTCSQGAFSSTLRGREELRPWERELKHTLPRQRRQEQPDRPIC